MTTDADLVTRWRDGGRREALAAIFDRHAPALYDTAKAMTGNPVDADDLTQEVFVTVAEQLGQLRDPDKLRPWMFAILRRAVYARSRQHTRVHARDIGDDAMAPSISGGELDRLTGEQLAADVRAAARGLHERDQYVLELVARQQLNGAELALALGVTVEQSYVVVSRMRDRVQRSLGAYVVARVGRRRCTELDRLLARWDGTLTPLLRKRIGRHIDRCTVCAETKHSAAPLALVAAAPAAVLPGTLRRHVLDHPAMRGGEPDDVTSGRSGDGDPAAPATGLPRSTPRRSTPVLRAAATAAAIVAVAVVITAVRDGPGVSGPPMNVGDLGLAPAVTSAADDAAAATTGPDLAVPGSDAATDETPPGVEPESDPTVDDDTAEPAATTLPPLPTTTSPTSTLPPLPPPPPGGWVVTDAFVVNPAALTITSVPVTLSCAAAAAAPVVVQVGNGFTADSVELAWSGPGVDDAIDMAETAPSVWRADAALLGAGEWTLTATAQHAGTTIGTDTAQVVVTTCPVG